jgi:hypothetical protein
MKRWLWLAPLALGVACGDDAALEPGPATGAGATGGAGAMGGAGGGGAPSCGTARSTIDAAAEVVLSHDDGVPATHVREQTWQVTTSQTHVFNESTLHEAVRFELEHPALIYGFEVMWAGLPEGVDPTLELEAGLYGDFGYNGFDFWAPDPLWTGTRCAADVGEQSFAIYALDEPIAVDHPGLVYVAHRAAPGEPVWWFDATVENPEAENPCEKFDDCQSAFNLPEADANTFYNGLSLPFQYHFMVRLHVAYTDAVEPADKIFQPVLGAPSGGHVSWADFDDDGFDDLLIGGTLWKNGGDGTFSDVTAAAGLAGIPATGGVWGDYDNDGCLDVFLFAESYTAADTLMRSLCDGTFEVASDSGIVDVQSYNDCGNAANTVSPSAAAAWVDLDADGWLDLYVANFNCWNDYTFYKDTVFSNQGDGSFVEITAQNGFSNLATPSRGVAPIDHDRDGDVDVFVNNYVLKANLFFENLGDGTFQEKAKTAGLAGSIDSGPLYYGHTIGAAWGDLDNDGDFDNVSANLAHPRFFHFSDKTQILLNDGVGNYADLAGDWATPKSAAGLRFQETHSVPALADFDHDGVLDLAITAVYDGRPTDFYWGNGDGTFTLDAYHAGITTENGWGIAVSDFDNDGDPDLFATQLFENTRPLSGHWLQLRVVGVSANRAGIGATVAVKTGATTRIRHVQGGTGKGGQDSLYLHYGLGDATAVDEIVVTFPGGASVTYPGPLAVDKRLWLFQDDPVPVESWGKP